VAETNEITLYGTSWCGDCRIARFVLDKFGVNYLDVDIDVEPEAGAKVIELNNGNRSVPTILFPDGSVLVEPGRKELENKLRELALI
jgi:mycoredoxin